MYWQLTPEGDPSKPTQTYGDIFCDLIRELDLERFAEDHLNYHKSHWLTTPLGFITKDEILCRDIGTMPHMLVAGTTGSGKSVFMSSLIAWLHLRSKHDDHVLLIDPKCVEFSIFEGSPLLLDIITEVRLAFSALNVCVGIMEKRFKEMKAAGIRDIREADVKPIIIVIDEWADLILQNKHIEEPVIRLAQKGRAAGMHLIIGTQRPTRDVVTGLIKANFPARVCFAVPSALDSRIVLDESGAEDIEKVGEAIYLRGRDRQTFTSLMWTDDQIKRAIKCAKMIREEKKDKQ